MLQRVQNRGLRLALGCHAASAVDFLHAEAKELKVEPHLRLLTAQYLARALQPHHVNHDQAILDPGPRRLRETFRTKSFDLVQPFLNELNLVTPGTYPAIKNALHTAVVEQAIDDLAPNRVLNGRPPLVYPNDVLLPRITQTTLTQLRSGHCARLKDFQLRIGKATDDLCPDCRGAAQSTCHLFDCPSFPTSLAPIDLWENPWDAAIFIQQSPSFDFLPPPGPVPPRRLPPRRPPPAPILGPHGPIRPLMN